MALVKEKMPTIAKTDLEIEITAGYAERRKTCILTIIISFCCHFFKSIIIIFT